MISSNPTAEERVQYEAWLADAEAAYHRLMIGAAEVSIGYDGESATFTRASKAQLSAYIGDLRRALGKAKPHNQGFSFNPVVFGSRS